MVGTIWWHSPTVRDDTAYEASFDAWSLRFGLGVGLGPVVVSGGTFVAPFRFSDIKTGVVWGGHGEVLVELRMFRRTLGFASIGLDRFSRRIRLVAIGERTRARRNDDEPT